MKKYKINIEKFQLLLRTNKMKFRNVNCDYKQKRIYIQKLKFKSILRKYPLREKKKELKYFYLHKELLIYFMDQNA